MVERPRGSYGTRWLCGRQTKVAMARNRSRTRSAKRRKEPERSGKNKASRSRSRKKKARSRSPPPQKKRSPSRDRGRGRNRSPSPSKGKGKNKWQQWPQQAKAATGTKGGAASPSPDRAQRASPSYDRGGGSSRSPSRDGSRRSKSAGSRRSKSPAAKQMEVVSVNLNERPFGMAPSKEAGVVGYVVSKVAEDKPADAAGVKQGWRIVSIAGKDCRTLDLEAIQVLVKGADLPLAVDFEREAEVPPPKRDDDDDSDEEIDILDARAEYRKAHQAGIDALDELPVTRSPEDLPEPIKDWQDAVDRKFLNKSLLDKLVAAGLKRPTLIQRHALPVLCHKQGYYDLIASAQTGSGKTFAFVIPTVARIIVEGAMPRPFFPGNMAQASPLIVVLSPTRELAMQTTKEIEVLTKGTNLISMSIYGGESLKFQQQKLVERQTDIICATPGRLLDLVDAGKVSLSFVQSVILDEADQMFEQSLEVMCTEILTGRDMPPPQNRQTLLFSATMPQKCRDLCQRILRQKEGRVANLTIGHYEADKGGACASIKQVLRWVPEESHRAQAMVQDLHHYWINQGRKGRVVIFTNQRLQAGHLANNLTNNGIACLHLHGKLEQAVREEVFDKFRKGQAEVLVATNVASRGLDFPDISFVVQYNLPGTVDIYTHRIGRTGRVGQVGCSLSYVGPKDRHLFPKLVEFLELCKQEVPSFLQPRDERRGYGDRDRGWKDRGGGGGWYDKRSRSRGKRGGYDNRRRY